MVIITGTSRGLGLAIAKQYLDEGKTVLGIGRTSSIEHPNYSHQFCDLQDPKQVAKLSLPGMHEEIIFIHNAGILGTVNRFSDLSEPDTTSVMQVNFHAGVSILHQLLKQSDSEQPFTAVFISSGAGKRPIASWAAYCASKAAVDLFLSTIQIEEDELGRNRRFYAFSPGVVDTEMQEHIRTVEKANFSSVERFINLKEDEELQQPEQVSKKLIGLIETRPNQVLWSVSDL